MKIGLQILSKNFDSVWSHSPHKIGDRLIELATTAGNIVTPENDLVDALSGRFSPSKLGVARVFALLQFLSFLNIENYFLPQVLDK
ncbi:MAG: hypothetical protein ACFFB3_19520 [Candidatus Hodarchaeota archaeon]